MSEIPQNEINTEQSTAEEKVYHDEYAEFTTLFSDPQEKKPVKRAKKGSTRRQLTAIIAGLLAVCLLAGGTVAVIKLVPEKTDEDSVSSSLYNSVNIVNYEVDDLDSVTVTNANGKYTFLSETSVDAETSAETVTWYIDGIDKGFVSSENVQLIAKAAASVKAMRTISGKTAEECGFNSPKYTVEVTSEEHGSYTLYVGYDSPDQTGTYVMLGDSEDIYLVYGTGLDAFDFDIIELADTTKIPAAVFKTSIASYCDDEGTLNSFDTMTIGGKRFSSPIVLAPNTDSELASYLGYVMTSHSNRYANPDRIKPIFKLFSEGITVAGAYTYDVTAASLAKYRLNDPDVTLTISVGGEKKQYKFSIMDETYCAVVGDDVGYIRKVTISDVPFVEYKLDDFYSSFVYINAISNVSNVTVALDGGESYSFDITENEVDEDAEDQEECTVTCNGEQIKAEYFQNFYQTLIAVTAADYTTQAVSEAPSMTVTFTRTNGEKTAISYNKVSATKYQYSENGVPVGRIVSSEYNKLVKYVKRVANNQNISG